MRENPLPPGVYWQDIFNKDTAAFDAWLDTNKQTIKVVSVEPSADGEYTWILFRVLEPTQWQGPGLPTIAERGEETKKEDTVQRPPPEKDPLDTIGDVVGGKGVAIYAGIGLALAGIGIGVALARR